MQDQMATLFGRDKSVISRHIKNIFAAGELMEKSVVANFATTASDGKKYQVDYYNLDVIISVGYRVNSHSKANEEYDLYKEKQHIMEHLDSFKELDEDIKRLKNS